MNDYLKRIKNFLDSGTTEAKITNVVLGIIAVVGVTSGVFIFAGIGNVVRIFSMFKKSKKYSKGQIKSAMTNLYNQKLIKYVSQKNGLTTIQITMEGKIKLKSFSINLIKISKPKKWDKKWRIVMFDLPVRYNKARESLRFKLKQLGFVQFQKSVWIYPYPCIKEILFITDYYKVGKYVEILEVTNLLREDKFKRVFGL